jgi:hypothetical protein
VFPKGFAVSEEQQPHVTCLQRYVRTGDLDNELLSEKFEAFTFSPAGAAVYQLGNFGTARRKLKSWEVRSTDARGPGPTVPLEPRAGPA